ncbi:DNA alkylation repair protein [Patescibacteria group bacterium]|nr:DNA alkylation repair protein [Patescibacteria group bacterium]
MATLLASLTREVKSLSDPERARRSSRYFKTKKGDYGHGDVFIGLTMPVIRVLAKKYRALSVAELTTLVRSRVHEERMLALIIMTLRYPHDPDAIYTLYLTSRRYINNWDLVDVSASKIVGDYLSTRPRAVLYQFAKSKNLWERRIAIVATAAFIAHGDYADTLTIAAILIRDPHDLIHKAAGWMLREVGKRDQGVEEAFLAKHARTMPRTMLRSAIERLPERKQRQYLSRS